MSGLCGAVSRGAAPISGELLATMEGAVPHRVRGGVARHLDREAGFAAFGRVGGPTGSGALFRHPGTGVVVAADARLDNRTELLRRLGNEAPPPSAGDAELVAAAYLRWGADGFAYLIGDFAFVLRDPRERRLLLVRDPMAMRALYYRLEPERVLVATEAKQLLAVPGVPNEPDETMAAAYLAGCFGALDRSYFRGISQVPPAHVVVIEPDSLRVRRYWDVDPGHEVRYRTQEDYAERLRELYLEAVRARVAGERPVGVFLSGGVDSTAAASAAGWWVERDSIAPRLHSYSWDFGRFTECDEREISRLVVDRYGITGRDVPVEDAGPLSGFPHHAPDLDDPFHGHFQTMVDRGLARAAQDEVGPLLTGMRGDLVVGPTNMGFAHLFEELRWAELLEEMRDHAKTTGAPLHRVLRGLLLPAVRRRGSLRTALSRLWSRARGSRARGGAASFATELPPWVHPELARRAAPELRGTCGDIPAPPLGGAFRPRRYQLLFVPMHLRWSVSHERRAAWYGLEAVDAWSDRRIAEYCVALPQSVIDPRLTGDKHLARQAMVGIMPENVRLRARKTLPTPVFEEGFRQASQTVWNLLHRSEAEARGWIDPASLKEGFARFLRGGPLPDGLWFAISLEWWLRVRAAGIAKGSAGDLDAAAAAHYSE